MPSWIARYLSEKVSEYIMQVIRYGVVGVINNTWGYLIYLLVTWLGLEPKLAITLLYPIGAVTAYFGHAKYSFAYRGKAVSGIWRFVIAQLTGYTVNVVTLHVFSDLLGFPHQLVQAASIFIVAGVLFVLFRYYVFRKSAI